MVYHTFVSGEVLTAANVMNDLMNQSVIVCTSGTRPAAPVAGMTIFETDTNQYAGYSGTAWVYFASIATGSGIGSWTTYTPTFTNLTGAAGLFAYRIVGKTLFLRLYFSAGTVTATGTFAISLPSGVTSIAGARQALAGQSPNFTPSAWVAAAATTMTNGSQGAGVSLVDLSFTGAIEVQ